MAAGINTEYNVQGVVRIRMHGHSPRLLQQKCVSDGIRVYLNLDRGEGQILT